MKRDYEFVRPSHLDGDIDDWINYLLGVKERFGQSNVLVKFEDGNGYECSTLEFTKQGER